jgi:hypothetical protein
MPVPAHVPRLAAVVALLLTLAGFAAASPAAARAPHAVLAFLPSGGVSDRDAMPDRLAARSQLAIGLVSATQGRYSPEQTMLDVSAGSRTSAAVYDPPEPPHLDLVVRADRSGFILGWSRVRKRASTALAEIRPGLLASRVPGGGAYAGVTGRSPRAAAAAAAGRGDVAAVSLGPAADLAERVARLERRHRLVVAGLPTAARGDAVLDALLRDRMPGDLLIVMQTPPRASVPQLLPAGAVLDGAGGMLTSQTTRLQGIVAAIDIPVTILRALDVAVPRGIKGQPIRAEGVRDPEALEAIEARLRVVSGRRTPTILALLFAWAALTLALGIVADRRGIRAGMRIGGLAMLWVLPVLLLTGWLAPARSVEIAIVVGGSFALGALTDLVVRWPRGPLVPAAVALLAYGADLAFGSKLIIRSLLGVNPRSGSRFYGLGNELEATLVVMLLVALGALLMRRADFDAAPAPFGRGPGRSRRGAAIVAIAGVVAAVFIGAGQLGADVGGVITLGGGIGVMTLLMAPGTPSRLAIVLALLAPVAALAGLAGLDLATGGDGHFTRTILQADSARALWDVVVRRYTLAYNVLRTGVMPFVTALAVLSVAYAARHRERVYAPLRGSPAWRAALAGALTASVVGALFNDSGPILLVLGVFMLACVTAYVRGDPRSTDDGRIA